MFQKLYSFRHRIGCIVINKTSVAITTAVLLCVIILGLVFGLRSVDSLPTFSKSSLENENGTEGFTLLEVISGKFSGRHFNGTWVSGNEFVYIDSSADIVKYNVQNRTSEVLVSNWLMFINGAREFSLSADQKYIWIMHDVIKEFRHSTKAKYAVLDIDKLTISHLANGAHLDLVNWLPNGNALYYVLNNTLYYKSGVDSADIQASPAGSPGVLCYGIADWVYEEEVFSDTRATWPSPDGKTLVYLGSNDSMVDDYTYIHYGKPEKLELIYPEPITIKYPKAGTPNPTVNLMVFDSQSNSYSKIGIETVVNDEYIIHGISWMNTRDIIYHHTNRVQNSSQIIYCRNVTSNNNNCVVVYKMTQKTGWLDIIRPVPDPNGSGFATLMSQPQGSNGNYRHLTLFTFNNVNGTDIIPKPLTSGLFVVTSIIGWDIKNNIYYTATEEGYPSRQQVYSISASGNGKPQCLSCSIKNGRDNCRYATASPSFGHQFIALNCIGPGIPTALIHNTGNSESFDWEVNSLLRKNLEDKIFPDSMDEIVPVEGGFNARARLWLPPNFNKSESYPMIVFVYAGPNSLQITDVMSLSGNIGLGAYFTTTRNFIYCLIDGRGSANKGDDMLFAIYKKLGTVEMMDQISVTKYLQQKHSFIDAGRTAIWGWSYGGYATTMSLVLDTNQVFKCGIAVAPVTSYFYYDSIYTERYMGLPTEDDNKEGYLRGTVVDKVANLKNKKFLLAHGNSDDNVHYQNSMNLARALEDSDIMFQQQSYPDENHSLGHVLKHLYHTMDNFWTECLGE